MATALERKASMPVTIIMPKFGLSMEEGTIGEWFVKEGDAVKAGQPIANVSSEKLNNEATAPQDGVVAKLLLGEGDTLPCGEPIAILAVNGESVDASGVSAAGNGVAAAAEKAVPSPAAVAPAASSAQVAPAVAQSQQGTAPAQPVKITPRAKKIAEAKGLSYAHIVGTGRHGFITIEDLKREGRPAGAGAQVAAVAPAAQAPAVQPQYAAPHPTPLPVAYTPAAENQQPMAMTPMQKAVSNGMMQSLAGAAQVTIMTEANVQPLMDTYEGLKGKYNAAGVKLSVTAMLVKAVAMALENHPAVRRRQVDDSHIVQMEGIDIGIAVDVPDGLIVPVIRAANLKDLRAICLELADLAARAKTGALVESEMGGAVITVSNLGMFGITYFTPVLNTPEPCLLGVGAITQKPVIKNGGIFTMSAMNLSLTHDHRTVNGAPAARFLQEMVANLCDFRWV